MKTALLDGDVIGYIAAAKAQRTEGWDEADAVATFAEQDVDRFIAETIDEWTARAGCTDRRVLVTESGNFRYSVDPTYKGNRKNSKRPVALDYAKSVLRGVHGAMAVYGLEADDLIGLSLTGSYADNGVAVSIDKDMMTLPGMHLNPNKDEFVRTVTALEADRYWMTQTLTGDSTDGYPGCPGVGPKGAEKALAGLGSLGTLWGGVLHVFSLKKLTHHDALRQARLARILRRGDYDKATQEVLLWHPSTPTRLPLPTCPAPSAPPNPPAP